MTQMKRNLWKYNFNLIGQIGVGSLKNRNNFEIIFKIVRIDVLEIIFKIVKIDIFEIICRNY